MPDYLPTREAELVSFVNNFNTKISVVGPPYNLTAAQVTAFNALHAAFISAWDLLQDPDTRTSPNVQAKDTAKADMIDGPNGVRELVGLIQKNSATTNADRAELQITIPDPIPTPSPIPSAPPQLTISDMEGRKVSIRLRDVDNPDNRKPDKVKGATLFWYAGDTAPDDINEFTWEANTGETDPFITFPLSVPEGAKVWITASWFNNRSQNGPFADPVPAYIQFGGEMAEAA